MKSQTTNNSTLCDIQKQVKHNTKLLEQLTPKIDSAMRVLEKAFKMICNAVMNLREEQSEFAGTCINENLDKLFV